MHSCMPTILNVFPGLSANPVYALSLHGGLGVPVFFCISGFCIANAAAVLLAHEQGWQRYVLARVRRIYPPYLCATVLVLVLTLLVTYAVRHHLVASSVRAQMDLAHQGVVFVFASLFLLQVPLNQLLLIGPVWSLNYEVAFYVVVLVVLVAIARTSVDVRHFATFLHVITLVCLAGAILVPGGNVYPFNLWPEFGIGVVLFDLLAYPGSLRPAVFGILILSGCAVYVWLRNVPALKTGENSTALIYGTCIAVAVIIWQTQRFEAFIARSLVLGWLSRVGMFSYSLYLTHEPITGLVLQLGKRAHLFTEHRYVVLFVIQIVVAVAFGYGFYLLCEAPFVSRRAKAIRIAVGEPALPGGKRVLLSLGGETT